MRKLITLLTIVFTAALQAQNKPMDEFVDGGNFVGGSRINAAQEVCCRYMAEQGWFAINVDYSLAGIHVNEDKTVSNPYNVKGELEER